MYRGTKEVSAGRRRVSPHRKSRRVGRALRDPPGRSFSHDAAGQMARCIIILKDVDGSPFSRVPLDQGQGAIGTEGFDGLWFSVKIIVTNLTLKNAVRVFLNEINLTVVVAIAFDQDKLVVIEGFNHIGLPIAIGVDSNLVLVRTNPADPLVGPPALIPMRNNQPWIAAARGCREGQSDNQGQRLAHDFV